MALFEKYGSEDILVTPSKKEKIKYVHKHPGNRVLFYCQKTKGCNKMDIMQTGTVLAIVVMTYLIGAAAKLIPHIKDEYIPVIVGMAGGALGAAGISSRPV